MQLQKLFVALGAATTTVFAAPFVASAFTIAPGDGGYITVSEGVAQYGDNQVTKTGTPVYETTLTNSTLPKDGSPLGGGQAAWTSGATYNFSFEYNPLSKRNKITAPQIKFSVKAPRGANYKGAAPSLSALFNYNATPFDALIFGLTADAGQSVTLTPTLLTTYNASTNKAVKTTSFGLPSLTNAGTGSTAFWNIALTGNPNFGGQAFPNQGRFKITGTAVFTFPQGNPAGSRPRFSIAVGRVIPTPALLPAMIGFGAAALRKKRQPA